MICIVSRPIHEKAYPTFQWSHSHMRMSKSTQVYLAYDFTVQWSSDGLYATLFGLRSGIIKTDIGPTMLRNKHEITSLVIKIFHTTKHVQYVYLLVSIQRWQEAWRENFIHNGSTLYYRYSSLLCSLELDNKFSDVEHVKLLYCTVYTIYSAISFSLAVMWHPHVTAETYHWGCHVTECVKRLVL